MSAKRNIDRFDIANQLATERATPPQSVKRIEYLLIAGAAVSLYGMFANLGHTRREMAQAGGSGLSDTTVLMMQAGFILFSVAMGFAATRLRSRIARRAMKVTAVLMLINPVMNYASIAKAGFGHYALFFAAIGAGILYFSTRPDAKAWFAKIPASGDGTPSATSILRGEIEDRL